MTEIKTLEPMKPKESLREKIWKLLVSSLSGGWGSFIMGLVVFRAILALPSLTPALV